ncbi:MAG: VWA domain-containing protein [Oligoflexia bacterium]|nr:VWA domain-containing protein [Oligoflexia bacterium]
MFDPSKFTTQTTKPLPVVLILDVSGSMSGSKIDNLNKAVEDMLESFIQEEKMEAEIIVSVMTFGDEKVTLLVPFTKASQVKWQPLQVSGDTPMGEALKQAKAMIEDKTITPSRAYRPTVVLVSDGQPTDGNIWKQAMEDFIKEGRSSKCDRMAMAIGRDADEIVLKRFMEGTSNNLFYAENANQIHEFFKRVTMSVSMRTKSKNPNIIPDPSEIKLDGSSINSKINGKGHKSSDDEDNGYW